MLPRNHPDRLAGETAVSAAERSSSEFAAFRKTVMIGTLVAAPRRAAESTAISHARNPAPSVSMSGPGSYGEAASSTAARQKAVIAQRLLRKITPKFRLPCRARRPEMLFTLSIEFSAPRASRR